MKNTKTLLKWNTFCTCKSTSNANFSTQYVFCRKGNEMVCDFSLIGRQNTKIPSLIVNNNPLNKHMFSRCVPMSENIVLSDGGANHFYDTQFRDSDKIRALVGDFDCINNNILEYYGDKGKALEYIENWQQNDFDKALDFCVRNKWNQLFCFGAFGGRMDQTLAAMHLATKYCKRYPHLEIVLLGNQNIMFHLKKNLQYRIKINQDLINPHGCGLISFGKSEHIETSGFRWNLGSLYRHQKLEWGKFISTCNQIIGDQCYVQSSEDIFFVARYGRKIMIK